ncbi:alpha/beta hydrolase [Halobacillus litoralis]|uniref:alpha/beta hydrolase family protein n=1 Tax=Halobacillus litoralis TaxID=45668 RepID=UPI001CD5036F|nr:alpha/beta hydrolase [Halobacillus litoralis]MCA0972058.1 alpha/beta hydrolase [Halobacillus litoralis]
METIYYGENENQFGQLRLPEGEGPHPVAVVIHGGFWRSGFGLDLVEDVAEDLSRNGWATWSIEYRRTGQEGGGWPGTFLDTALAIDHLRTLSESYPINVEKVVTIGHSAGGHLALWAAARHRLPDNSELYTEKPLPITAAVSLAGVSDLSRMHEVHQFRDDTLSLEPNNPVAELLSDHLEERYKEASPIELLPLSVPQVLVHGSLDVHVPVGISDHYFQWAENMGDFIKYVEISEAEHFMLTDTSTDAWARIREEMDLLKQ